jgi:PAS domain S-box-containing protein
LEHTVKELEKEFLEYKNAKESVFRAKEQLERMFNAVPDHIAIINRHYRIQIANKSLADKLGCPQERLVGELCYKHICRANRPPASCLHSKMLNDGKEHLAETYNRHLEMNLLITSSPLYDDEGKLIGGVHVARDITTHKETEKALRQSEEKGDLDL